MQILIITCYFIPVLSIDVFAQNLLEQNLPAVEDKEIHYMMSGLISILSAMSDEQFQEIDSPDAIDALEDVSDLDVGTGTNDRLHNLIKS